MIAVANAIDRVVVRIGKIASWLFLVLIAVILFDVITRRFPYLSVTVFRGWLGGMVSSTRLQELQWHLHTALFVLALGWAYARNGQVRVDLVREGRSTRTKLWIEALGVTLFLIPFCLLMLGYGFEFVRASFVRNEGSSAMSGLGQRWIIKSVMLFGIALLLMSAVAVWLRAVDALRRRERGAFNSVVFPSAEPG